MKKFINTEEILNHVNMKTCQIIVNTEHITKAWPHMNYTRVELKTGTQIDLKINYNELLGLLWN